jgi:hypothetical protein
MARVGISLPNIHMGGKKITTRKRSLTRATRKIRNSQRRSPTDKHMSVRTGT